MAKARTLVGLDVHATKIVAAVQDGESGELRSFAIVAQIGVLVFLAALVVGAVLIAACSVLALRTGTLGPWLGWAGALTALIVLVGAFIVPSVVVFLLLAWVIIVSAELATQATNEGGTR